MSRTSTWRLALRIARRDALRAKGRSALVVAMIALPILGVTAADLAFRSGELSQAEELTRQMGAADAEFTAETGGGAVLQSPENDAMQYADEDDWEEAGERSPEEVVAELAALLPPGTEVLADESAEGVVHSRTGLMTATIREFDAAHPVADGRFTLLRGHYPRQPGEVAATQAFLDESGLHVGSELRVKDGEGAYRITGAYEQPDDLDATEILARPGAALPLPGGAETGGMPGWTTYLADVPEGGVTWDLVLAANERGLTAVSRDVLADPPPDSEVPLYAEDGGFGSYDGPGAGAEGVAVVVTVVSLIILEICLLAGPAFAVGARRSRRQLGLIGANGGDRRHLRAVMLASGAFLGAVAAVIGVTGGLLLTLAGRPLIENQLGSRFGAWDFRVPELAGIAVLAVVVGLLAALVPALAAARGDVLESLTGRRGTRRTGRVLPVVGTAALGLGAALAIVGGLTMDSTVVVAIGAVVAELGLVALTPLLVGLTGRLGRRLPLAPRLALRDIARNRARTAPAVAAVLAAVAGTVAVATVMTSEDAEARAMYVAEVPEGTVSLSATGTPDPTGLERAGQLAERDLPVDVRADIGHLRPEGEDCAPSAGEDCGWAELVLPAGRECPLYEPGADSLPVAEQRALADDPRCGAQGSTAVAVAGPELLDVLGLGGAADRAALERGEAVVFAEHWITDGSVGMEVYEREPEYDEEGEPATPPDHTPAFPARLLASDTAAFAAVISPATAEAAGLRVVPAETWFSTTRLPTNGEQQRFEGALADELGAPPYLGIEDGFESETTFGLLILGLAAMVITLGAAGIATGLAQADSEPDLATLSAVGATPRLRRTLSGLQCGLIAALGVFLGVVSGLIPALGLRLAGHRSDVARWEGNVWGGSDRPELFISLPWGTFAQLIVVVPLVACLLAALLTRSRIPLARRAG